MMRSFVKKLAFTMALSMVVTTAAPAGAALAATEFTYAYQEAGRVTELNMKAGDEVNLRFLGVKDYKNYTLEWKSNNPLVATVDKNGVVKAVENGVTTIELVIGDGSVYTSTPVIVNVGTGEVNIALGTSKENTSDTYALEVNETVDLGFYGVPNYSAKTYKCTWTSDDTEVATVDKMGVITAVTPGTATVTLTIVNTVTDEVFTASATVVVTAPVVELTYEVKQISDTKATITFNDTVEYTKDDVVFSKFFGDGIEQAWPLKNVEIKDNVITVEPYVAFADGDVYIVKVGVNDEGTKFVTKIGVVDEIRTTFKSLDKDGKAYTNGEEGEEIIVSLDTKLYSNGIDVTNVYGKDDITYTLSAENENVMIDEYAGEVVFSKENVPVTVIATYVYYDENDEEQKVKDVVGMTSELAPAYRVTGVKAWTILSEDQTEVDWNAVRHSVPAYDEGFELVILLTDNYGNIVCTKDNLTHKNLKDVQNYTGSRLETEGYYVTYSSANVEKLLVGEDGSLTTYIKTEIPAIIALNNYFKEEDTFVRNLSAPVVSVKDKRKISKVTVSDSSVTLVTDGEFTTKDIEVKVYDQYNTLWDENADINVTCNVANTTGYDAQVTYAASDKGVITLDGSVIDCDKNTLTLTFKEEDTGKTASLKVSLKDPKRYDSNEDGKVDESDEIKVTSYKLRANNVDQYIEKQADGTVKKAAVNFYTLSNGYEVGTVNEEQTALVVNADQLKLTSKTASKGAQFLVVYAPDGTIVGSTEAASSNGLGLTGTNGKYEVVVANGVTTDASTSSGLQMKYAQVGTYTVKVLQVSSFNKKDEAVFSTKYSTTFKVENNNKAVKFQKQEKLTSDAVSLEDIVVDTLKFTLGGSDWAFTAEMIADVATVENASSGHIVITSVTFNVPLNGKDDTAYYTVTVDVNKSVEVPAYFK